MGVIDKKRRRCKDAREWKGVEDEEEKKQLEFNWFNWIFPQRQYV